MIRLFEDTEPLNAIENSCSCLLEVHIMVGIGRLVDHSDRGLAWKDLLEGLFVQLRDTPAKCSKFIK